MDPSKNSVRNLQSPISSPLLGMLCTGHTPTRKTGNGRIETVALRSMTALKSMSIEKLVKLKSDVETMLAQKVSEERRSLEQELTKLGGYMGKKARGGPRGAVVPKYRDPETGTTWAGRGLKPRWLTAALKSGKSVESFAIAAGKATRGKGRKKAKAK
jgi:DNA-binding protein H-NS